MSGSLPLAIDCRNLTYRYGNFTAVDDLTLQVRPGETMGLLGPNGAGKTTVGANAHHADTGAAG